MAACSSSGGRWEKVVCVKMLDAVIDVFGSTQYYRSAGEHFARVVVVYKCKNLVVEKLFEPSG